MTLRGSRLPFIAIAGVWLVSLALPAVQLPSGASYDGAALLRRGWMAGSAGVLAWYANPAFVCAAILGVLGWARSAGVLSGIALLLGLTSLAAESLVRQSGTAVPAFSWAIGFHVWLASLAALCVWSWTYVARERFALRPTKVVSFDAPTNRD